MSRTTSGEPVAYYPDPYPSYYCPIAAYFAGVVTGALEARRRLG